MKSLTVGMVWMVLWSMGSPVAAQERAGDVALSYSTLRDYELRETFTKGWVVSAAGHLWRGLSLVGEVGGNYRTLSFGETDFDLSMHAYLGGIRIRREHRAVTPFAQVLAGMARAAVSSPDGGESDYAFALQPGGGVDIRITDRLAVRVQGDYRFISEERAQFRELRVAAGLAFGLGGHR